MKSKTDYLWQSFAELEIHYKMELFYRCAGANVAKIVGLEAFKGLFSPVLRVSSTKSAGYKLSKYARISELRQENL